MARKLLAHLRDQWIGTLALLLVLTGGTAYALDGSNTVFTDDIVNGQVKVDDIGQGAVATDEIGTGEVKGVDVGNGQIGDADLAANSVKAANIANGQVQAEDLAADVSPGATGARAWGHVNKVGSLLRSKRVSGVSSPVLGVYCIDPASGIDTDTAVVIATNDFSTDDTQPAGNDEAHVEWVSVAQDCPDNTLEVRTFVYDGNANGTGFVEVDDEGFAFVIP
jgi:hypothetical protein